MVEGPFSRRSNPAGIRFSKLRNVTLGAEAPRRRLTVRLSVPHVLFESTAQRDCAEQVSRGTRQASGLTKLGFSQVAVNLALLTWLTETGRALGRALMLF